LSIKNSLSLAVQGGLGRRDFEQDADMAELMSEFHKKFPQVGLAYFRAFWEPRFVPERGRESVPLWYKSGDMAELMSEFQKNFPQVFFFFIALKPTVE